jgi:small subunit ribosomal protein S20
MAATMIPAAAATRVPAAGWEFSFLGGSTVALALILIGLLYSRGYPVERVKNLANLRSAIRHIKKSRKRAERNQSVRSAIKTFSKKTRTAIADGDENAAQLLSETAALLDKAAKRNIIHKNAANRRKSRMAKRLNAAQAQSA